jgi:alkylresorcinol/alkylpyrone synthase
LLWQASDVGSGILAVATALPEHRLEAASALAQLRRFWPQLERLEATAAGIGTRYTCEPVERLLHARSLTGLRTAYLAHAKQLAGQAARKALAESGLSGGDVDMVVTVSCTGYLVPSLDVHLAGELGLRPDVIRVPITELGCSGGAAAIALAHRHLLAFPDHKVLVMAVELPSLNFQPADRSLDSLTACLVFGDGAGAAVIGSADGGRGLRIMKTASHLVPGTEDLLGFDLRDGGFHVVLDRRLPRVLDRELRPAVERFMAGANLCPLDFLAAHAGGPRIFDAMEAALALPPGALELSREVFAAVGNTSSASIFFILEKLIGNLGSKPEEGLGLGLGPGITLELMHLAWTPLENSRNEASPLSERLPVGG